MSLSAGPRSAKVDCSMGMMNLGMSNIDSTATSWIAATKTGLKVGPSSRKLPIIEGGQCRKKTIKLEKRQPEEQCTSRECCVSLGISLELDEEVGEVYTELERVKGKARGYYIYPGALRRGDKGRGLLVGDAIDPRQNRFAEKSHKFPRKTGYFILITISISYIIIKK